MIDSKTIKIFLVLLFFTVAAAYLTSMIFGSQRGNVAFIKIDGEVSYSSSYFSASSNSDELVRMIESSSSNPAIKALFLEINSPGGTVVASRSVASALAKVEKPTVCLLKETATSGAYWIASACDWIIADEFTLVGNIGVTGSFLEFSEFFEKYGISYIKITSGDKKDLGTPFREPSSSEISQMQEIINEIHLAFVEDIAENRNLEKDYVMNLSDGSIFTGRKAVELKLIDETGNRKTAVESLKSLANVSHVEFFEFRKQVTMYELFMNLYSAQLTNFLKNEVKIEAI